MNKSDSPPILINGGVIPNEHCFSEIINTEKLCELVPTIVKENSFYSKKIQRIFNNMPEYNEKLLDAIIPNLLEISTNKYGNYLIREILKSKEKNKVDRIFSKLKGHIKELYNNECGKYVAQELIKKVDEKQLEEILDEFIDNNNFEKSIKCENEKLLFIKIIKRQAKNVIDKICEKILNSFVTHCDNIYFNKVIKVLLPNCSENNYDLMFIKCCVNKQY